MKRRAFALFLAIPLLANCSESTTTPMAPKGPVGPLGPALSVEGVSSPVEWQGSSEGGEYTFEEWQAQYAASPLQGAPGEGAVMVFGNPDAGSDFSPPGSHDQSFHARDRINPGSVTIDAGQTVTFQIYIGHRVAIYDDGVRPQDIVPNPGPFVLDPNHRLILQPSPVPQFTVRFLRPGKYLVICAISNHFFGANMWGWIHVR